MNLCIVIYIYSNYDLLQLTEFEHDLTVYDFRIYFKYKGHYKKETFIFTTFILIVIHIIFCLIMHLAIC